MLRQSLSYAEGALRAATADEAGRSFFQAVQPLGATYLQTRHYRRPLKRLTSDSHWASGGFITRIAPPDWPGSDAFNYICFDCNPLLGAIRESRTRYRFSDFAPFAERRYGAYWDALGEARIADALCATSYGTGRAIASLHLGFGERTVETETARAVQMAGLLLTERLMEFDLPPGEALQALTDRERDSLAFVSDGKTDWEISVILGVSEATVRFHVDNARRKLGATNRAQAVARLAARGLL